MTHNGKPVTYNEGLALLQARHMTQAEWIINRMQELDRWHWAGLIGEVEYQELTTFWRRTLPQTTENDT